MSTKNPVPEMVEQVRRELRACKGNWRALAKHIRRSNPRTKVTYRWLVSFSDRQDGEPVMSKLWDLAVAIGMQTECRILARWGSRFHRPL